MILVEGPDNSGKTTLIKELHKLTGWKDVHYIKPSQHLSKEDVYHEGLMQLMPREIILDRCFFISENVYGPIVRSNNMLGKYAEPALLHVASSQMLIIYCRPPMEHILGTTKPEMNGVRENHRAIVNSYDAIMGALSEAGAFVHTHDWTCPIKTPATLKNVQRHVEYFNETRRAINNVSTYFR